MGVAAVGGVLLGVVILWYLRMTMRARRIISHRAGNLSAATGIPADTIRAEIIRRRMTPGEWATEHGLDPIHFRPLAG